jgi:hypothetical protein
MSEIKLNTIRLLSRLVESHPAAYLWLASSGGIITGKPISPIEYLRTITGNPNEEAGPLDEDLLALKDVLIKSAGENHVYNVALVDLNLVSAWGAYDPASSFRGTSKDTQRPM